MLCWRSKYLILLDLWYLALVLLYSRTVAQTTRYTDHEGVAILKPNTTAAKRAYIGSWTGKLTPAKDTPTWSEVETESR